MWISNGLRQIHNLVIKFKSCRKGEEKDDWTLTEQYAVEVAVLGYQTAAGFLRIPRENMENAILSLQVHIFKILIPKPWIIGQAVIQYLFLSWKAQQKVTKKDQNLFFRNMALTEGGSFLVSSILSLLIFSAMQVMNCNNVRRRNSCSGNISVAQVYKGFLASSQLMTIATGFTGSLLFVFLITAGAIS